ncbi:MAG: sulfite exporter TauE/SafE family protein [Candidatus Aenigmarchaeota archaeon]|nr:sulfite exporter TauE/SafE family protein [Candidatus Aenigmarchaeota archaeon]
MDIFRFFIIFVLGFVISTPSSMIGLTGGFLFVPILILIFQLPAQNAIAISLVAITGTTVSATLGYMRQRRVDLKLGLLYDILDVPGVVLGAYLTTLLPSSILTAICGVFLIIISVLSVRRSIFFLGQ